MGSSSRIRSLTILVIAISLAASLFSSLSLASATEENGLRIYTPFVSIVTEERGVSIPLTIENLLEEYQVVALNITCPEKWSYNLVLKNYQGYNITQLLLKPKESVELTLSLEPGEEVEPGSYMFYIYAMSGKAKSNLISLSINLRKSAEIVLLEAASRSVTGSPGSVFSFRFTVKNNGYKDLTFALSAQVPEGWQVLGFRPSAYEATVISTLTVKARDYSGAVLQVWCPEKTPPGTYPIKIIVAEGGVEISIDVEALVSGTPKINLKTYDELLSYELTAGETKEIVLVVENAGNTNLLNMWFACYAPSGWRTSLSTDRINILPQGSSTLVSLLVTPPSGALAGDYSLVVRAYTMETSTEITLRLTVIKPTYWGIVGLVVVVASVLGLVVVFRRYGRP
ncbi:MAG: NEW3 domain-containing protein [Candidatus Nezhaarchaeales archaeon]